MTEKDPDRIERIEEIAGKAHKVARLVRRRLSQTTKITNDNFDLFNEEIKRNSTNIDKIVHTLEELMGEKPEENNIEKKENEYVKMLYQ